MPKASLNLALLTRTRDAVNADRDFRRFGTCDARVGIKVGESAFVVDFEAFECAAVAAIERRCAARCGLLSRIESRRVEVVISPVAAPGPHRRSSASTSTRLTES